MPPEQPQPAGRHVSARRSWLFISIVVIVAVIAGLVIWWAAYMTIQQSVKVADLPQPVVPTMAKCLEKSSSARSRAGTAGS